MERDKPKVPVKPHRPSDVARGLETKPITSYMNEAIVNELKTRNKDVVTNLVNGRPGSDTRELELNTFIESTDDTSYYENIDPLYYQILEETGVSYVIKEILSNEKLYITRLNYVIQHYMLPSRTMGEQMNVIFGNINGIKEYHETIFYPDLLRCKNDLIRLIECFSKHIAAGNFYIYVVYTLNRKRSESERNKPTSKTFFQGLQNKIDDRLGIDSFLVEPIQRIFKYKNLIDGVLSKVKNEPNFIEIMVTITKASHHFTELLTTTNKAMAINDINDSKINLMNQGNFLTHNEVNIYDCNQKRKYKGNIFLFQNCIVCTERISPNHQFKNYFPCQSGQMECISENKFELSEGDNCKIEVTGLSGESTNAIQHMMKQIRRILNQSNRYSSSSASSDYIGRQNSGKESNHMDYENRSSNSSDGSGADSASNIRTGGEFDISPTHGYMEKQQLKNNVPQYPVPRAVVVQQRTEIIEEMLTNENNYVDELTFGIQTYMTSENKSDLIEIFDILGTIQQIKDYHKNTIYNFLKNCDNNVTQIANIFSRCIQEGQFNSYILLALKCIKAEALFTKRAYREYIETHQRNGNDNKGFEYYLHLPLNRLGTYIYYLDRIIHTLNIDTDTAKMAALCSKAINEVNRLFNEIQDIKKRKKVTRKLTNLF